MDQIISPPALQVDQLSHAYGQVAALNSINLTVGRGELLTIVGPSGSGKTSLLRILAGFEIPNRGGRLRIGGVDMLERPPNQRPVATVFQHYALFPHLSVGKNVEYGLLVRGVAKAQRRARAAEALEIMRLPGREQRRISELSGGERQRVAFARALVTDPEILLLDEPMGALDEPLRRALEAEIRGLQRKLGTTVIQVTHGREEALAMSDRLVV
ncbi:ABC transporter ATP-binding protein, partial [Acetobacteraceae bacterium]|nr:ABC transporter ATP-binding protein [Acetobacteraceae bacterium]